MRFTLIHASGNHFLPPAQTAGDTRRLLRHKALIYTITEAGDDQTLSAIRAAVRGKDYTVINPDQGDIAFIVANAAEILHSGGPLVIPAEDVPASQGGHTARCNSYVQVNYKKETITHTGVHFVTAHPDPHHTTEQRRAQQLKQAGLMGEQMRKFSRGRNLATGSGDLNASIPFNTAMQGVFDTYGLTTTAKETGNGQTTHHGARLDYIWTADRDNRVSVESMKVLKDPTFHSDHDPVVAVLRVRPLPG